MSTEMTHSPSARMHTRMRLHWCQTRVGSVLSSSILLLVLLLLCSPATSTGGGTPDASTWQVHDQGTGTGREGTRALGGSRGGPGEGGHESAVIGSGPQYVRWCCVGAAEFDFCKATVPALSDKERAFVWSCVQKGSKEECMDAIVAGEAELVNLDAGLAYRAFIGKRMKAILSERLDFGESFDAVAVVRKDFCPPTTSTQPKKAPTSGASGNAKGPGEELWRKLRSSRSCHAFYGSSGGWDYPTLLLQALFAGEAPPEDGESEAKQQSLRGLSPDAHLLGALFAKSCAPSTMNSKGSTDSSFLGKQALCSGCVSANGAGSCDLQDPFAGYAGAFRCVMEGAGDVAFTRSPVALRFSQGGHYQQPWSSLPTSEFRYLCPPSIGGCIDLVENPAAFNCTLGRVPANVVMTRNAISELDKQRIIERLETAGTVQRWRAVLYEGNNPHDLVLSSGARGLVRLETLSRSYLGEAGVAAQRVMSFNFQTGPLSAMGAPRARPGFFGCRGLLSSLMICIMSTVMLLYQREQGI